MYPLLSYYTTIAVEGYDHNSHIPTYKGFLHWKYKCFLYLSIILSAFEYILYNEIKVKDYKLNCLLFIYIYIIFHYLL